MDDLAVELDCKPGWPFAAMMFALFAGGVCCINTVQALAGRVLPDCYLVVHAASWAGWFLWEGVLFPRARERALRSARGSAYAAVFYRHVLPGVCWGVSHMTLPVLLGLPRGLSDSPVRVGVGLLLAGVGTALLATGFRTIGFARAGFLSEYRPVNTPIRRSHVYALMRHPLFVGGALASVGGTLALKNDVGLAVAALNVLILPIYQAVEDRRLVRVFGQSYGAYARSVGGIAPRLEHLVRALRRAHRLRRYVRQAAAAVRRTPPARRAAVVIVPRRRASKGSRVLVTAGRPNGRERA